jgi:hypothetical protein
MFVEAVGPDDEGGLGLPTSPGATTGTKEPLSRSVRPKVFDRGIHEAKQRGITPVGLRRKARLAATFRGKAAAARVGYPKLYGAQPGLAHRHAALSDSS